MEEKYKNGDYNRFSNRVYSKDELELSKKLHELFNPTLILNEDIFYGEKQFIIYIKDIQRTLAYDFKYNNKIIEYNGDYWHCNPKYYEEDYFHKFKQCFAGDIWKEDKIKKEAIERLGYDVKIVWEDDYLTNKEKVIEECLEFLKN